MAALEYSEMNAGDQQPWLCNDLLSEILKVHQQWDCEVSGLTIDSREVKPGYLFLAYPGGSSDGRDYITQAIECGAVAVLAESRDEKSSVVAQEINGNNIPIFSVPHLKQQVGQLAAKFYHYPAKNMSVIGVTGTNGKTSCCHYLTQALEKLHTPAAAIGTLGWGSSEQLQVAKTMLTTVDPVTLQQRLKILNQQQIQTLALEASSHGLAQYRLNGINIDLALFTNLTQDHLDYHRDMADYAAAKERLFQRDEIKQAVINLDDNFGRRLIEKYKKKYSIVAYSCHLQDSDSIDVPLVYAKSVKMTAKGLNMTVVTPWGEGRFSTSLLGRFTVHNLLAVIASLGTLGYPLADILAVMPKLQVVPGRMQSLGGHGKQPLVVVDYAHTPDALEQALSALREHCQGRLWCVFGCGGDRDQSKRPLMGQIAERYSDHLIITDDNPRGEESERIADDIIRGLLCPWAVVVEHDRHVAIAQAVIAADPTDTILIAGKGHEKYQLIRDRKMPFDDVEQAKMVLQLRKKLT